MTQNTGTIDRIVRLLAAAVLLIVVFATDIVTAGALRWGLVAVAAILAVTAAAGVCPAYGLLGIRTCRSS